MGKASSNVEIVVLAGGQGSRFWPISRSKHPKQFLSISPSGESLIQATVRRVLPLGSKEHVTVVTNVRHESLVKEHVPYAHILSEPVGRNTAAAIGLASLHLKKRNPGAVMLILASDHAVTDEAELRKTLDEAIHYAAKEDVLVTVGVAPEFPHTGYGYIKRGSKLSGSVFKVDAFFEKPTLEKAKDYLASGDFYWNASMFVWRPEVFLDAVAKYMPSLAAGLNKLEPLLDRTLPDDEVTKIFSSLEAVAVDVGILEKATNCVTVVSKPFGWNDVGSWGSWAEHFESDPKGNVALGDVLLIDSKDCIVHSEKRITAVVGAENLVIVDSGDALLVCPRDKVQEVRKVVEELKKQRREDLI